MPSYAKKIIALRTAADSLPEYAEILPFFSELFCYLDSHGTASGISLHIPEDGMAVRVANGFPLISPDLIQVDRTTCVTFLQGVLDLFRRIGREGGDDLGRIEAALLSGEIEPLTVFQGILERKRPVIDEAANTAGVPSSLLEYVFEVPLKAALELYAAMVTPEEVTGWQESFCPVCGSRAGMAELSGEEGKRYLCCSACTFRWSFKRLQCPYCGNEETENLSYFTAGDGTTRVDTCKACSRYIKTRDSRKGEADRPLDLEDMLTIHLDLVAAREGFERGK